VLEKVCRLPMAYRDGNPGGIPKIRQQGGVNGQSMEKSQDWNPNKTLLFSRGETGNHKKKRDVH